MITARCERCSSGRMVVRPSTCDRVAFIGSIIVEADPCQPPGTDQKSNIQHRREHGSQSRQPCGRNGGTSGYSSAMRPLGHQSPTISSVKLADGHVHASHSSDPLAGLSSVPFGGLLEVLTLLHVLREAFLFAELLETTEHLLRTLATASLDSNRHNRQCSETANRGISCGKRLITPNPWFDRKGLEHAKPKEGGIKPSDIPNLRPRTPAATSPAPRPSRDVNHCPA